MIIEALDEPMDPGGVDLLPDHFSCVFIFDWADGHKLLVVPGLDVSEINPAQIRPKIGKVSVGRLGLFREHMITAYLLGRGEFFGCFDRVCSSSGEEGNAVCPECGGPGILIFNVVHCFRGC